MAEATLHPPPAYEVGQPPNLRFPLRSLTYLPHIYIWRLGRRRGEGWYAGGKDEEWSIHLFTFYIKREKALDLVFLLLFMPNPPPPPFPSCFFLKKVEAYLSQGAGAA